MAFTQVLTLYTQRLVLRPLSLADAPAIVALAGDWEIKVGLLYEGCRRQHTLKWGEYRDIKLYGLLREDWKGA